MAVIKQTSFIGGEFAPYLWGRSDLPNYAHGLRTCRNFFINQQGAAVSRPGTTIIRASKLGAIDARTVRLIPFYVSATESYVLEFGNLYVRFHSYGATVLSGGTPYEVTTPYAYADLWDIRYAQVGDVLTLTHPSYAPRELARYAATTWVLSTISFARPALTYAVPKLDNATLPVADATHPAREWTWVATEIRRDPGTGITTESAPATVTLTSTGAAVAARYAVYSDKPVKLTPTLSGAQITALTADPNFISFRYYRGRGGLYGWIGDARTEDFTDVGQEPDYAMPPPQGLNPFSVPIGVVLGGMVRTGGATVTVTTTGPHRLRVGDTVVLSPGEATFLAAPSPKTVVTVPTATTFTYTDVAANATSTAAQTFTRTEIATAVTFFEERRVFGGTQFRPGFVFASATGDYYDFDQAQVPVDGQAVTYELAARRRENIRHLVSHQKLLAFTDASIWTVEGSNGPLDSNSVQARVVEENGGTMVPPVIVDGVPLYVRAKGVGVRALEFGGDNGYVGADISAHARHLFDPEEQLDIVEWAHAEDPFGVTWAVRRDGSLMSLTFSRSGQFAAWAQHRFEDYGSNWAESICVVPEAGRDAVYIVARRLSSVFVERLDDRGEALATARFPLDCRTLATVGAGGVLTGLSNLNGMSVHVGIRFGGLDQTFGPYGVSAGTITVPGLAGMVGQTAQVGMMFNCDLETLDIPGQELRQRQCTAVGVEVIGNVGLQVGPTLTALTDVTVATVDVVADEGLSSQAAPATRVPVGSGWGPSARVAIRQSKPLHTTVVGLVREFDRGD